MRVIEYGSEAIDLSRTETGLIRLRIGSRAEDGPSKHIDLYPADARVLAHTLLAAAERETGNVGAEEASDWPEEYWSKGSFPSDQLRESN